MSQILFSDLADYNDIIGSLKNLSNANKEFGDSSVETNDRVAKSIEGIMSKAQEYKNLLITLDSNQQNGRNSLKELATGIRDCSTANKDLNTQLKQNQTLIDSNNKVIDAMTDRLESLEKEYNSLGDTEKKDLQRKKEIRSELLANTKSIIALTNATTVAGKTVKAAENSFDGFKQQAKELKKVLDTMPDAYVKGTGKINDQNKAAVALNDQYQKQIELINKINRGQRATTTSAPTQAPQSTSSGLSSLAAGAVGGAAAIVGDKILDGLKKAGDVILKYDSLDSALKVVSNDTALFAQRQAMLSRISNNLGQDLDVVEKTYTNLTASSKGTRLEGAATDKIYEQIVGTMGRLKKPAEDVEGALLAVGQMMSKGTVQSEELRGQLGERVPGAFNIAAKAMGVTTQKLGDMLKSGQVVASDFLPKFAAELERTFNPNHEQRVEGLAANMARLRNEGVEWVKSINIGDAAGEFIGWITSMSRSVRELFSSAVDESTRRLAEQTEKVNNLESALPPLLSRYDELKAKSKLSTDEQKELQTVVNSLVGIVPSAATGFDAYGNALDVNKSKVFSFTQAQRELNAELNKGAIKALQDQTAGSYEWANQTQNQLSRGTKQKSFSLKPYFLMSDEEKRQANDKNAGKRREVALSDNDRRDLSGQLQDENKKIELSITQRLQLGDKLTDADKNTLTRVAIST